MDKRKGSPDVLAELLGGDSPGDPAGMLPLGRVTATVLVPEKWEYRLVSFQDYKGWRPRFINGSEIEGWTGGPLIHDYLAQMGEQGWELAAASSGERLYGAADRRQLYFKRSC
jgi:hypothetical protein